MQNFDYINYTFSSLGFSGVEAITKPSAEEGNLYYDTLMVKRPHDNIIHYLCHEIIEYVDRTGIKDLGGWFLCGVAYMMNGAAVFVYNGMGESSGRISGFVLDPDYYKAAEVPKGLIVKDNYDYLRGLINSREPDAMTILQEIPSPNKTQFHFRIVHDEESDELHKDNIIIFPKKKK